MVIARLSAVSDCASNTRSELIILGVLGGLFAPSLL
jgi:hypothetical protein